MCIVSSVLDKMAAAYPREISTKDLINTILDDYEKLTKELFDSLSAASLYRAKKQDASSGDTAKAIDQLISKEKQLQAAVQQAHEQQLRQQEIQTVREEITKKDQEILNLESQLKEAEKILAQGLFQAKKKLSAINQANKGMVSSEELIKYAHRISSSNAVEAPVSWMPGDPRRPYPQDIEMRSGWLGQLVEGFTEETSQPMVGPAAQELPQTLAATTHVASSNGIGSHSNGNSTSLPWKTLQQPPGSQPMELPAIPSSLNTIQKKSASEVANGEQGVGVDEVEFMSSSSSSSSSDSP